MISVEEANKILSKHLLQLGVEEVNLPASSGRILAEDLVADRDFPAYNRVTMDGIAISYGNFKIGQKTFEIESIAAAGSAITNLGDPSHCIEVMTGSVLPNGTDTVIRYEDIEISDRKATINAEVIKGQNIHYQGEDKKANDLLIQKGTKILGPETALAASIGKHKVKVRCNPRIVVITTGDELVEIDKIPAPHQIRKSNNYMIAAVLNQMGIETSLKHINDNFEETKSTLQECIGSFDIIILSGGVSKGKFDFVPKALATLEVEEKFHRISQRPGKPFWFGCHESGVKVFGFPGNPVSSFLCFEYYFIPWINKSMGLGASAIAHGILTESVSFKPDLTYFIQVKLYYDKTGKILARPIEGHGSGDLTNLVTVNAFMKLPADKDFFAEGEAYPIYIFNPF